MRGKAIAARLATITVLVLTAAGIAHAPTALARPGMDCGPMGKGEVYIVSGRDLDCTTAVAIASHAMSNEPVGSWTCQMDRFTGWCTQPPDLRIELH